MYVLSFFFLLLNADKHLGSTALLGIVCGHALLLVLIETTITHTISNSPLWDDIMSDPEAAVQAVLSQGPDAKQLPEEEKEEIVDMAEDAVASRPRKSGSGDLEGGVRGLGRSTCDQDRADMPRVVASGRNDSGGNLTYRGHGSGALQQGETGYRGKSRSGEAGGLGSGGGGARSNGGGAQREGGLQWGGRGDGGGPVSRSV